MKNEGMLIKKGRSNNQFIHTGFEFLDSLNEYAGCETLGFYIALKSYINRSSDQASRDNQITYSQAFLEKKLGIGKSKYYRHLKMLFNAGLVDIDKTITVKFFVNYDDPDIKNPLVEKSMVYFSTLDNINIPLKGNLESLISENYPEFPKELIKIVSSKHRNSYIIHDNPPLELLKENNYKFLPFREWDFEMDKFKRGENKNKDVNDTGGLSQNEKGGSSQNEKDPLSQNEKVNNINKLSNTIITLINQEKPIKDLDISSFKLRDEGLTEIDRDLEKQGFKTYENLIYEIKLNPLFFKYPYSEWINAAQKAVWQMYYNDTTKIEGKKVSRYDVVLKLQNLSYDIVYSTLRKVVESSKEQPIEYPTAFLKTALFNEIDEFSAAINAQVNYNSRD